MRKLALLAGLLGLLSTPVHAFPVIGTVQTNAPSTQSGGYNIQKGTVTQEFSVPYLTPGQCASTDSLGRFISVACGSGGGGYAVQPATVTFNLNKGVIASTLSVSGTSVFTGAVTAGTIGATTINTSNFTATVSTQTTIYLNTGILDGASGNRIFGISGTGGANLFAGNGAGNLTGAGLGNQAIGYFSLVNVGTGTVNTAEGASSMQSLTSGSLNTGVGGNSMFGLTAGNGNTAYGYDSGYNHSSGSGIVNGSSNTFIGFNAGTTNSSIVNGVAIGANSLVTTNNTAVIGGAPNTFNTMNLIVSSVTVAGISSGQCLQTGSNGLVTGTGSSCGAGGGSGASGTVNNSSQFSAAYYNVTGSSNAVLGSSISIYPSSMTVGNLTSTSYGNNPYLTVNSSGTSQNMTFNINGQPSGGVQNKVGGVTINALGPGGPPIDMLVIHSSYTSAQGGSAMVSLINDNPLRNDPMMWFRRVNSDSSPEMRWDSPSPNMEMVMNSGLNNAIGEGKWEPFAIATGSRHMQCGSNRANDNGTFENLCELYPLYSATEMPGVYYHAQSLADDSGLLASSDTASANFFSLNAHTVGLTGPQNPTASYVFSLPSTVGSTGAVLYHAGNRGGNFSARSMEWTAVGTSGQVLTSNGAAAPTWTTISGGGGTSGQVNNGTQNTLPFYSVTGSSNVLSSTNAITMAAGGGIIVTSQSVTGQLTVGGPIVGNGAYLTNVPIMNPSSTAPFPGPTSGSLDITGSYNAGAYPAGFKNNGTISLARNGSTLFVGQSNGGSASGSVCVGDTACNSLGASATHTVAVGNNSLSSDVSGEENTCVGYGSCAPMTSNRNTMIGAFAGGAATTASSNVGIGWDSLAALSTGTQNTCVGTNACDLISFGSGNAVFGDSSGADIKGGMRNTCIGGDSNSVQPCSGIISGSSNTAVGNGALGNISYLGTESANTTLGYQASVGIGINKSVCIGYGCVVNSSFTAVIGNVGTNDALTVVMSTVSVSSGTVTTLNSSTTTVRTGLFVGNAGSIFNVSNGKVGVGTPTPAFPLDVAGDANFTSVRFGGDAGTSGQCMISQGVGVTPIWGSCGSGGGASLSSTNTWTAAQIFANGSNSTADAVTITSSGTGNSFHVNASGNFGNNDGASGGSLFKCDDSQTQGPCMQIYSNQGTQGSITAPLYISQNNTAWDNPNLYIVSKSASPQNGIRIDGSDYSALALIDTLRSQSGSSKNGKFQFSSHNNQLRGERRNAANNSFESAWVVDSSTGTGVMLIGTDYSRPVSTMDVEGAVGIGIGVAGITPAPVNGLLVQGNSIFQSSVSVLGTSGLRVPGAVTFGHNSQNANYTTTATDHIIYASSTVNGITITLGHTSNPDQEIMVFKVDHTTYPVVIQTASGDTIGLSTGTMNMYGPGQQFSAIFDGVSNWNTTKVPITPEYIGQPYGPQSAAAVSTSSDTHCQAFTVPDFVTVQGTAYTAAVANGNVDVGIYSVTKAGAGTLLAESGSNPTVVNNTSLNYTTPAFLVPGQLYYKCLDSANTVSTFDRYGPDGTWGTCQFSGTFPLAASLTFTNCTPSGRLFVQALKVFGGAQK